MVGFAQVGMALEQINAWPLGSFAQAYEGNLKGMNRKGLEASLVATRLLQFMENKPQWHGTASELLATLTTFGERTNPTRHQWPQTPHHLSQELKRLHPALALEGLIIEYLPRKAHERLILIENSVISVTGVTS
jgi:hypothetical protein